MDNMFITPMNTIQGLSGITEFKEAAQGVDEKDTSLFGSIFGNLINDVRESEDNYMKQQYLLSTGQIDDPHTVPIAAAELQLSVDLLVQLRNKALEAYNSLITIST